jgi:broad specificity phosphatase PhoE
MRPRPRLLAILIPMLLLLLAPPPPPAFAQDAEAAWAALRQAGHVALVRHATAPGTGDPASFRLDDCATQRNLSPAGRAQAKAIGANLRWHGVGVDGVYSSQWCRCLETARLMGLGEVIALPALNSFFAEPEREPRQMAELRVWLADQPRAGAIVLVTHQVVITALTGIVPASGEIVVVRSTQGGDLELVGRIPAPD